MKTVVKATTYLTGLCCFIWLALARLPTAEGKTYSQTGTHNTVQVNWQAELAETKKKLEAEPNSAFLHSQAAVAYNALGDFSDFEREIAISMKLEPENTIYFYMGYAVYQKHHLTGRALNVLDAALRIDPANPYGQYQRALLFEHAREWQKALTRYEIAQKLLAQIESDPHNFRHGAWTYVDGRGNPFDVSSEEQRINDDVKRIRANLGAAN
jgi:tetratricopeptide (TPR) repeat protein